jgi:hypothetical protein
MRQVFWDRTSNVGLQDNILQTLSARFVASCVGVFAAREKRGAGGGLEPYPQFSLCPNPILALEHAPSIRV